MFRKILLGLSAGALAGLAHAEIKLVDGGFETTKPGAAWRLPKGWSFVPGAGVRLEDGGLKVDFDGLGYAFLKLEGNHGN